MFWLESVAAISDYPSNNSPFLKENLDKKLVKFSESISKLDSLYILWLNCEEMCVYV